MAKQEFFIPVETLGQPRTGECLVDHWWFVDPAKGAMFYASNHHLDGPHPMANRNRRVHEVVAKNKAWAGYDIVQIPAAYMGHADEENARQRKTL